MVEKPLFPEGSRVVVVPTGIYDSTFSVPMVVSQFNRHGTMALLESDPETRHTPHHISFDSDVWVSAVDWTFFGFFDVNINRIYPHHSRESLARIPDVVVDKCSAMRFKVYPAEAPSQWVSALRELNSAMRPLRSEPLAPPADTEEILARVRSALEGCESAYSDYASQVEQRVSP